MQTFALPLGDRALKNEKYHSIADGRNFEEFWGKRKMPHFPVKGTGTQIARKCGATLKPYCPNGEYHSRGARSAKLEKRKATAGSLVGQKAASLGMTATAGGAQARRACLPRGPIRLRSRQEAATPHLMAAFPIEAIGSGVGTPVESTGLQKPATQKARRCGPPSPRRGGLRRAGATLKPQRQRGR